MKKYKVNLSKEEKEEIGKLIASGKYKDRKLKRALILQAADLNRKEGSPMNDEQICDAYQVSIRTVERTRKRLIEDGFDIALHGKPKPVESYVRIMDGELEAHLVAVACSEAPQGYDRWTVRLLADELVKRRYVGSISRETVRTALKKTKLNPGKGPIS